MFADRICDGRRTARALSAGALQWHAQLQRHAQHPRLDQLVVPAPVATLLAAREARIEDSAMREEELDAGLGRIRGEVHGLASHAQQRLERHVVDLVGPGLDELPRGHSAWHVPGHRDAEPVCLGRHDRHERRRERAVDLDLLEAGRVVLLHHRARLGLGVRHDHAEWLRPAIDHASGENRR
jgi:hypothetical protein